MVMMDDPLGPISPGRASVRVSAKVNLALGVGPRSEDGFHPLATVFESIGIHDEITVTERDDDQIVITVSGQDCEQVPTDSTNLAWRAADLLRREWCRDAPGADIHVEKSIPVAGGMAGGSADAAGALLAAAMVWNVPAMPEDLHELAGRLGSDVPFCLAGGVALGRGRGDRLVPVICRGRHHWVIATSSQGLSTPAVYRRFDELGVGDGDVVPTGLISALTRGDLDEVARRVGNDLQAAALDLRPELAEVLEVGTRAGALAGLVSGSGPTCAFLTRDMGVARIVAKELGGLEQVDRTRIARGPAGGAQLLAGAMGALE